MRPSTIALLLVSSLVTVSCSTAKSPLQLEPVGPAQPLAVTPTHQGALVVYSAFEVHGAGPALPDDIRQHSSYRISSAAQVPPQEIENHAGPFGENPEAVLLTPGNYIVSARANGFGLVTVPVTIAEGKTTEVHLEGGKGDTRIPPSAAVKLPSGQIIGWKAASTP
jgi:hypothetical protein